MRGDRILEARDQMIVIREKRPGLQYERIMLGQFQSRVTEEIQLRFGIKKVFLMERRRGDDVGAVGCEIVRGRVRPTLAHAISYHIWRGPGKFRWCASRKSGAGTRPHSQSTTVQNFRETFGVRRVLASLLMPSAVARSASEIVGHFNLIGFQKEYADLKTPAPGDFICDVQPVCPFKKI